MTTLIPPTVAPAPVKTSDPKPGILEAASKPRELSTTLPSTAYTDPAFAKFEENEIFKKEWISLAHVSQIPNPGDFDRVDLCGEPLLVVRGKDNEVRVLSRVCRHRGMDLMPSGFDHPDCGHQRVILCPYHLWSYDLTGKLVGAPEMQKAACWDRSEVALHTFRSEIWEGFIFVTLSPDTPPLAEKYARLKDEFVSKWDISNADLVWSQLSCEKSHSNFCIRIDCIVFHSSGRQTKRSIYRCGRPAARARLLW
jgi:phenylpropionate dioxygenase-like ring-hydroxylating dioxygenase large terminal subunit